MPHYSFEKSSYLIWHQRTCECHCRIA